MSCCKNETLTAKELQAQAMPLSVRSLREIQDAGYDPHPWYGPCDGFADGYCFECAKVRAELLATIEALIFESCPARLKGNTQ